MAVGSAGRSGRSPSVGSDGADCWALRVGTATWLGCVPVQRLEPAATRIRRTPLDWLRADCSGLVLLSRDRDDNYRILSHLHEIDAEDDAHACELRDIVERPWPAPRVRIAARAQKPEAEGARAPGSLPMDRRRLEGLLGKVVGAGEARIRGTLIWAARLIGNAAQKGEIKPDVAEAMLVRAAGRAGMAETEARRAVACAMGEKCRTETGEHALSTVSKSSK
jgi:hypothetical protein